MNHYEMVICGICFAFIPSDLGALGFPTGTQYQQAHYNWHAQQNIRPVQQLTGTAMEPMPDRGRTWCRNDPIYPR